MGNIRNMLDFVFKALPEEKNDRVQQSGFVMRNLKDNSPPMDVGIFNINREAEGELNSASFTTLYAI